MGKSKTLLFTTAQNDLADLAKALAHPARIAIIQYLANSQSCINVTLVTELGLAQATISQHLRELKELGLVRGSIEGASVNYCLDLTRWREVQQHFQSFFEQISESNTNGLCCN